MGRGGGGGGEGICRAALNASQPVINDAFDEGTAPGCCSQFGFGAIEGVHIAALNASHRIADAIDEGSTPGCK